MIKKKDVLVSITRVMSSPNMMKAVVWNEESNFCSVGD